MYEGEDSREFDNYHFFERNVQQVKSQYEEYKMIWVHNGFSSVF